MTSQLYTASKKSLATWPNSLIISNYFPAQSHILYWQHQQCSSNYKFFFQLSYLSNSWKGIGNIIVWPKTTFNNKL